MTGTMNCVTPYVQPPTWFWKTHAMSRSTFGIAPPLASTVQIVPVGQTPPEATATLGAQLPLAQVPPQPLPDGNNASMVWLFAPDSVNTDHPVLFSGAGT